MRLWIREIAGWLLVLIGLAIFFFCFEMYTSQPRGMYVQAGALTLIGIIVFRGGIHLLKVAAAAQICLLARQEADRQAARPRGGERKEAWPSL